MLGEAAARPQHIAVSMISNTVSDLYTSAWRELAGGWVHDQTAGGGCMNKTIRNWVDLRQQANVAVGEVVVEAHPKMACHVMCVFWEGASRLERGPGGSNRLQPRPNDPAQQ